MSFRRPWIKRRFFGLVALVCCGGAIFMAGLIQIGPGYKAKLMCSGMFVAGRGRTAVERDLLPGAGLFRVTIDEHNKIVRAAFLGFNERAAALHPENGCTLGLPISTNRRAPIQALPAAPTPFPEPQQPTPLTARLATIMDKAIAPHTRSRAIVVLQDGALIAERYADGFDAQTRLAGWSMAKSVVNALVGILVLDGRVDISQPAPVPEWQGAGDTRAAITWEQLLHMSSGLDFSENYASPFSDVNRMLWIAPSAAALTAQRPAKHAPGTAWKYASGTTNVLVRAVCDTVGGPVSCRTFIRERLFQRIGMTSAVMEADASGYPVGSSFMYATARDWARFGLLYLRDGVWEEHRILPPGWVDFTRRPTPLSPEHEYGAHFWLNAGASEGSDKGLMPGLPPDTFTAWGFEQQFVTIVPSQKLVVARLGLNPNPRSWNQGELVAQLIDALKSSD